MSTGFLSNGQEIKIVEKIIKVKNYLDAVIQLPKNLFTSTGISAAIVVFKKNRKPDDKVMFLNAEDIECQKVGPKQILTKNSVDKIVDTINLKKEIDEFSKLVTLEDIFSKECNLNVSQYITKKIKKEEIDIKAINLQLQQLKQEGEILEHNFDEMEKELIYSDNNNEIK
jgi:type I restriction enzyme M protein